jgi:hypothetical protein
MVTDEVGGVVKNITDIFYQLKRAFGENGTHTPEGFQDKVFKKALETRVKGINHIAAKSTLDFPVIFSDAVPIEIVEDVAKSVERRNAIYVKVIMEMHGLIDVTKDQTKGDLVNLLKGMEIMRESGVESETLMMHPSTRKLLEGVLGKNGSPIGFTNPEPLVEAQYTEFPDDKELYTFVNEANWLLNESRNSSFDKRQQRLTDLLNDLNDKNSTFTTKERESMEKERDTILQGLASEVGVDFNFDTVDTRRSNPLLSYDEKLAQLQVQYDAATDQYQKEKIQKHIDQVSFVRSKVLDSTNDQIESNIGIEKVKLQNRLKADEEAHRLSDERENKKLDNLGARKLNKHSGDPSLNKKDHNTGIGNSRAEIQKRINGLEPTLVTVTVQYRTPYTAGDTSFTILVKALSHIVPSEEFVKFLPKAKFDMSFLIRIAKLYTREIKFWRDFIFNLGEIKNLFDKSQSGTFGWYGKLKRQTDINNMKRLSNRGTDVVLPTSSIVITLDEVEEIFRLSKGKVDLNTSRQVRQLVESLSLLNFIIVDVANKRIKWFDDTQEGFEVRDLDALSKEDKSLTHKDLLKVVLNATK